MKKQPKRNKRIRRHRRVRAKIKGTPERPRLSIFRSGRHIWAQLIDDTSGKTFVAAGDAGNKNKGPRIARAERIGRLIAKQAHELHIAAAVFDRGGYKYHGIVKAVAEGARKEGLRF